MVGFEIAGDSGSGFRAVMSSEEKRYRRREGLVEMGQRREGTSISCHE